ncbi:hypothetical protein J4Q44_G00204040, partial [Coregonus suidteri]
FNPHSKQNTAVAEHIAFGVVGACEICCGQIGIWQPNLCDCSVRRTQTDKHTLSEPYRRGSLTSTLKHYALLTHNCMTGQDTLCSKVCGIYVFS